MFLISIKDQKVPSISSSKSNFQDKETKAEDKISVQSESPSSVPDLHIVCFTISVFLNFPAYNSIFSSATYKLTK